MICLGIGGGTLFALKLLTFVGGIMLFSYEGIVLMLKGVLVVLLLPIIVGAIFAALAV